MQLKLESKDFINLRNLNIVNVGYGSISKYIFKKSIKSG